MLDFHTHPLLVRELFEREPDLARIARDVFFIRNHPQPLRTFLLELDVAGLERAVVLPIDARTSRGCQIYSNELIAELCRMSDRFIGFASVDPHRKSAVEKACGTSWCSGPIIPGWRSRTWPRQCGAWA